MSETLTADGQTKTYRGASIEKLLPQIRAELGPEAVIVRRREGLVGGLGGFFQKRCVEVDARAGGPRIDVYDDGGEAPPAAEAWAGAEAGAAGLEAVEAGTSGVEAGAPGIESGTRAVAAVAEPAAAGAPVAIAAEEPPGPSETHPVRNDAATREGLATPTMRRLVGEAHPFAELLDQMSDPPAGAAEPGAQAEPEPLPRRAARLRDGMVANGLGADLAAELVDAVLAGAAPFFSPGRLRTLVRDELALRLPIAPAPAPGRRRLAVVGPAGTGKTAAVARLAAVHAAAGQEVACLTDRSRPTAAPRCGRCSRAVGSRSRTVAAGELATALRDESAALALVDTPAGLGRGDGRRPGARRRLSTRPGSEEVHLAVRAGTAAPAAVETLAALRPLGPNRLLVTGAADTTYLGAAVDFAIRATLPIHYVAESVAEIAPADPRALASKVAQ